MKKVICLFITILFFGIVVCSCSKEPQIKTTIIKVDLKEYSTIDELYDDADIIVKGTIIDISVDRLSNLVPLNDDELNSTNKNSNQCPCANMNAEFKSDKQITTIYKLKLDAVYKGDLVDEEIIEVKRVGGKLDNEELILEGAPELTNGENYIFFLNKYYRFTNLHQSIYKIVDGKSIKPVKSGFNIELNYFTK